MTRKMLAAFILAATILMAIPGTGLCQGGSVAVFPFKNNGQPQYNNLSSGISAMFTTDLMQAKGIEVVEPQKVASAISKLRLSGGAPSVEDALKASTALGADYAITGEFVVFGSKFRIDIRLYDVRTAGLKSVEKAQAKEDALFDMVDDLSGRVIMAISGEVPVAAGGLDVRSEPAGAEVRIDGDKAGETPLPKPNIKAGRHTVEIELEGYQPYSGDVSVKSGETTKLDVKLTRLFGGIRVWWTDLPMSDVSISGPVSDTLKASQFQGSYMLGKYCRNLPAGKYNVTVRLPYKSEESWEMTRTWKTYSAEADVEPGDVVNIFINNSVYTPGIELSQCSACVPNWDFKTTLSWYEMQ